MEQQGQLNIDLYENSFQKLSINSQNTLYKTALYLRLSLDDGQAGDSTSIQTQRAILEKYCLEQGFHVVDTYIDDGYSGLNFNRPSFQRLLNDIADGKINLVITKDLSRLGRDYIQTGYYTEIFFPDKNVRYIAVNDNVDTIRQDNDIAPFKNILNDMYARDLSRKVKTAKRQQMYQGFYCSAQTAYGYKKDPTNKNRLVIDEEPAKVIREIFRLGLEGYSTKQIASELTNRKIMTPSHYKVKQGDTRFNHIANNRLEHDWNHNTILTLVKDMVYVGDMENHKYEVKNYKTKKCTKVPKDQRIIVQNTHEPIIDRDSFKRVQDLLSFRHRTRKHNYDNIFKSILFCTTCGYRLMLGKNKTRFYYSCQNHHKSPDRCPKPHYINYEELKQVISARLKKVFNDLESDKLVIELDAYNQSSNKHDKANAEKIKVEKRLIVLDKMLKKLYEDYVCEQLDIGNYHKLLGEYQAEQKMLNEQLKVLISELSKENNQADNLRKLKAIADKFLDFNELTTSMVNQLIDRIEIGESNRKGGDNSQEINIHYRFVG